LKVVGMFVGGQKNSAPAKPRCVIASITCRESGVPHLGLSAHCEVDYELWSVGIGAEMESDATALSDGSLNQGKKMGIPCRMDTSD
jgi:hypothetical protein